MRPPRRHSPDTRHGAAFILAVFALAILLSLATAYAALSRADIRLTANFAREIQCRALCQTGLALASARLAGEEVNDEGEQVDSLDEAWAQYGGAVGERIEFDAGWIRLEIVDASSRLSLNTAPREALLLLPDMTEEVADALLDWRDDDTETRKNGAEVDYYSNLAEGYLPADAPFLSVEECRLVAGVTDDLFFGDFTSEAETPGLIDLLTTHSGERNVNAKGEPRLNVNTGAAQELRQRLSDRVEPQAFNALIDRRARGGLQSLGQLLTVEGWTPQVVAATVDELTLTDGELRQGTVNLNTAPEAVLACLPGMTDELLEELLARRDSGEPLTSPGELIELDDAGVDCFRQSADLLATKSAYFLVQVLAGIDEDLPGQVAVTALLQRDSQGVLLLRWREADSRIIRKGWKWEA